MSGHSNYTRARVSAAAFQARQDAKARTEAVEKLAAYSRGERAAVERRDVELVLEQLHAAIAAGGTRGETKE